MTLQRLSQPEEEPISLAETKQHLRVEIDDDDALIRGLIATAREAAEHICRRSLVTSTWLYSIESFPASAILLPLTDVKSVASVTYLDSDEVRQPVDPEVYVFGNIGYPATLKPVSGDVWPAASSSVRITFDAGYGDPEDVPAGIKAWMKLRVGDLYNNRESIVMFRGTVQELAYADRLLDPFRILDI